MANAITLSRIGILISIFVVLDSGSLNGNLLALILTVLLVVLTGLTEWSPVTSSWNPWLAEYSI